MKTTFQTLVIGASMAIGVSALATAPAHATSFDFNNTGEINTYTGGSNGTFIKGNAQGGTKSAIKALTDNNPSSNVELWYSSETPGSNVGFTATKGNYKATVSSVTADDWNSFGSQWLGNLLSSYTPFQSVWNGFSADSKSLVTSYFPSLGMGDPNIGGFQFGQNGGVELKLVGHLDVKTKLATTISTKVDEKWNAIKSQFPQQTTQPTLSQLESSIPQLQTQLNAIPGQIASLQTKLDAIPGQIAPLQTQLDKIPGQITTLQTQLNTTVGQIAPLQTQLDATLAKIAPLQTQLNTTVGQITSLQTQLNTTVGQIASLQTQLNAIPDTLANAVQRQTLTSQITVLNTTKTQLTNQITVLNTTKTQLTNQITPLNTTKTQLTSQITPLNTTKTQLTSQISQLNTTKTQLTGQITDLNTFKNVTLPGQISQLNTLKNQLPGQISQLTSFKDVLTLQAALTAYKGEIGASEIAKVVTGGQTYYAYSFNPTASGITASDDGVSYSAIYTWSTPEYVSAPEPSVILGLMGVAGVFATRRKLKKASG
ncbi:NF038130 family PEP-CTERM protein [Nostoc sp. 'Peltigera membranacea cyanobiont' 210A]|uniref:NF038130 family PEP-CTERM protein n=1 Tax=Nostoc sp. 'Peltigera membranacea cyanobiont' 210A TaxID=2014529 RepID=UPI00167D2B38|nr:NF038130 family PEP-CTERM protein [Nostoc sp. 'Peltigera membranacea cyanobiont' 210A]